MSRKLQVNLPQPSADKLTDLATAADEPPSRLASKLLQRAIALQARRTNPAAAPSIPPLPASTHPEVHTASPPTAGTGVDAGAAQSTGPESPTRPPWLEPPGGDSTWRAITWGAIAALYARYPNQLQALQEDWWQDSHRLEHLAAIAHWRRQIDEGATDPREEIYFQETLDRFSDQLSRQPGSTATRWNPNAIPGDWSRPSPSAGATTGTGQSRDRPADGSPAPAVRLLPGPATPSSASRAPASSPSLPPPAREAPGRDSSA